MSKRISDLNEASDILDVDVLPIDNSTSTTRRITFLNLFNKIKTKLNLDDTYQKKLTFDSSPTPNSTNPVTSGGIATAIDNSVSNKLNKSDVVDNLTSTDTDKPLSAKQGNVLKTDVDAKVTDPSTKTDGQVLTYNATSNEWEAKTPSSGSTDYDDLTDKPKINSVELSGNKTLNDLGIASASSVSTLNETKVNNPTSKSDGQVLTYRGTEWVAEDSQGESSFLGTSDEWDALSDAEKDAFDGKIVSITDDYIDSDTIQDEIDALNEEKANQTDVDAITEELSTKTLTLTPTVSLSIGSCDIRQYGKIINISIDCAFSQAIADGGQIFTTSIQLPARVNIGILNVGASICRIATNGNALYSFTPIPANTYVQATITLILD